MSRLERFFDQILESLVRAAFGEAVLLVHGELEACAGGVLAFHTNDVSRIRVDRDAQKFDFSTIRPVRRRSVGLFATRLIGLHRCRRIEVRRWDVAVCGSRRVLRIEHGVPLWSERERGEKTRESGERISNEIMKTRSGLWANALVVMCVLAAHEAQSQQLGYKLLGTVGIDAGVQSPPGLAIVEQLVHYTSSQIRDAAGNVVPIDGLSMNATGSALGASYTTNSRGRRHLSFAAGVPVARIGINSDHPAASVSGFGFSDLFVEPIKVGWRERRLDVVSSYAVYAPTGHFEPRGQANTGRGYWTNQLSVGGALFSDSLRTRRASVLASYEMNTRKRGIDVRRGDMLQLQGGAGANVARTVVAGVAGYALWQVTPDRGADIPPSLRGERTRVFGLGPEVDVIIPRWRTRVALRAEHELGVTSRPQGNVISLSAAYFVARPR